MIIEGSISVKAAVKNHKRKIEKILIDENKHDKDFNYIRFLAKEEGIELTELKREELDKQSCSRTYGGILAYAGGRVSDEFDESDIFYIDGIEDPFNIGYIMRTLYAFGINNILLPERNYESMEAQILKSSAGAFDMMNVRYMKDIDDLKCLKKDYRFIALKRGDDASDIFDYDFKKKFLFMLGGEKRGISKSLMELCDDYLFIPYASDFRNSLNAASVASVVATLIYEGKRQ